MRHSEKKNQDSISNFIQKTYIILENEENSQIVSWTPRGHSFIIKDVKKFQEYILPIYFKHSNFSSFVRQLNMYNFHKVRGDRMDCEFEHEKFKKGQKELLYKIKRKQSESFIISQNIIDEANGNHSMQDSSQNIKKSSQQVINIEHCMKQLSRHDYGLKNQMYMEQLENLKRENKNLKAEKQNKIQMQKNLNTTNTSLLSEKFYKLISCLLGEKLQKQLRIENKAITQEQAQWIKGMNFDQIIQHVLSNTRNPMEFYKYSITAKTIASQQSDYDFMIRKGNSNSYSLVGALTNGPTPTNHSQ